MIRVVLIDDHAIVRAGFRALIECEPDISVAGEFGSVAEAEAAMAESRWDVLVLDIAMPAMSGLVALRRLRERLPVARVVVLSMYDREPYISEALRLGAAGYVSKAAAPDELVAGIRAVMAGRRYLSSDLVSRPETVVGESLSHLTPREREILVLLAQGNAPKQVAAALGISVKTAYVHRSQLLRKLGARSDMELYRHALEHGLLGERA